MSGPRPVEGPLACAGALGDTGIHTRGQTIEEGGRPGPAERERLAATLGALLKELRARYGLGTRALAERSALARSTVTRLEAGHRRPRPVILCSIAYGLDHEAPGPLAEQLVEAAGPSLRPDTPGGVRRGERRLRRAAREAGLVRLALWRQSEAARAEAMDCYRAFGKLELDPIKRYPTRVDLERERAQLLAHGALMDGAREAMARHDYLQRVLARPGHPLERRTW